MARRTSRVGMILDNRYEILSEVGRGGMSVVYLAKDRRMKNKVWAVKEFLRSPNETANEFRLQSLRKEAELMEGLDHPALPSIVDIIEVDGTIFIAMDYIEGENLKEVLAAQGHPMREGQVLSWALQLCDVLDYLHSPERSHKAKPIVYRDMKPSNIMLKSDGSICLIDFGIARVFDGNKGEDTVVAGTKAYMAPEQNDNSVETDPRADIYALGVTLHYLVTGRDPKQSIYNLQPIRYYNPQLSEGLEAVIAKCVQYQRDKRYNSCKEIIYDLNNLDKLTEGYRSAQKKKVKAFGALCATAGLSLLVGIVGLALAANEKASTYEAHMEAGDSVLLEAGQQDYDSQLQEKVGEYKQAIAVDPSSSEPYQSILSALIQDGFFLGEDISIYEEVLDTAASCEDYPTLYYDFAYDCFCFADNDSNVNYGQASRWFEKALATERLDEEKTALAQTYKAICDFRVNLNSNSRLNNLDESGVFVEYWNNLVSADEALDDRDVTPRAKLKLYELIADSCSSQAYVRPFMVGGIAEQDLLNAIDKVESSVVALDDQIISESDRDLSDYILLRIHGGTDTDGVKVSKASDVVHAVYNSAVKTAGAESLGDAGAYDYSPDANGEGEGL